MNSIASRFSFMSVRPSPRVGFRLVRPFEDPVTMAAMNEFWKPDIEEVASNAIRAVEGYGRGALGKVDEKLPEQMKKVLDRKSRRLKVVEELEAVQQEC